MYKTVNLDAVLKKFNDFVELCINDIKNKLGNIDKIIEDYNFVLMLARNFSIEFIIANKGKIIELDSKLTNNINILDFFYKKNMTNIEQVQVALNEIKQSKIFTLNYNLQQSNSQKNSLEEKLKIYNAALNSETTDLEKYVQVVEESNLSENEKLTLYVALAHDTVPHKLERKETNDNSQLESEYSTLKDVAQSYINKYYELTSSKDPKYIFYAKSIASTKLSDDEFEDSYIEERLIVSIFELISAKKDANSIDDLAFSIEILKDKIEQVEKLSRKYEKEKELESQNENSSEIYYLNSEGNLLFNMDSFNSEQKEKIAYLTEKILNGNFDYQKGKKHTKMMTKYKEESVFINKSSNMGCAFIRIDADKVLILNFDSVKSIFDSTKRMLNSNADLIKSCKTKILNNDTQELTNQELIKEKLNKIIAGGQKS